MKKIFLSILLIFFITGCGHKEYYINTIIENSDSKVCAITYPVTNIKKLDKQVISYIESQKEKNFKELNIDYTFDIIDDRYINIVLKTYMDETFDIQTFVFDTKKSKFLEIDDLVSKNSLITINQTLENKSNKNIGYNYDKLTFDENFLYFYFLNDVGIETVNVPIHDTEFLLDIGIPELEEKLFSETKKTKVIDPYKPIVALTFDDGPSKYTDDILDVLSENDANATFFVLGNKVKNYSNTLNKMLANGNEIGNHSYNHRELQVLSEEELLFQIETTQDIIKEKTGYTPIYLRPTYGNTNNFLKKNSNLEIVLWTVDPEDWKYKNSKTIANRVINKTKDGSIVLMHDTKKRSLEALKIIIKKLKEKDFQFVTISELKEVNEIRKKLGIK